MIKQFALNVYRYGVADAFLLLINIKHDSNRVGVLWLLMHCIKWGTWIILPASIALKLISSSKKVRTNIWLTVMWPGGSTLYLKKQLEKKSSDECTLVVWPVRRTKKLLVQINKNGRGRCFFFIRGLDELYCLRGKCQELVINHIIDWNTWISSEPASADIYQRITAEILALRDQLCVKIRFLVHDYFSVCPRLNLTNERMRYCASEYSTDHCRSCLGTDANSVYSFRAGTEISDWRKVFERLFAGCDEVRTFSEDSFARMKKIYPNAEITLVSHELLVHNSTLPRLQKEKLTIGVVGNIISTKGLFQVAALSRHLDHLEEKARIVVIGTVSDRSLLTRRFKVTGPYKNDELAKVIEKEGVNLIYFSSVWPETFSYVTHELIQLNMPIVCHDFGAPGMVVSKYAHGAIIHDITPESTWNSICALSKREGIAV